MRITFLVLKDYRHAHNQSSGPIGLAYLSAAAKARFPDTHVQIEVDVDEVIKSKPDLIGVSAFTETYSQSIEAVRYLKRHCPKTPIWLGGPHINALPGTLDKDFELGVVGEGEETFVALLELFRTGKITPENLAQINGIVYWEEGQRKITPPRDPVQDLDLIVPPDRSVMNTYWPPLQRRINWPQPIYTSRGCPFKCVFCIFSMDTQKVRNHSVERVILDIEDILRHYPDQNHITINDDLFAISKKRLYALTQAIRAAGLHKKVSFVCMAKASVFSDDMAKLMRDMNVSIVTFGLESGVERILHYLKGPRNKVSENVRAIDICARHGIRMGGYFIIGTPLETHQELQQAYWFIQENFPPMSMVGIYRLTPFPGTKFWQEAIEAKIVRNDLEDWRPFNYLDQDKRDYLFFNQHYSLGTFKEAYPHFARLTDRNHLAVSTERHELSLIKEIEPIYCDVLQRLKPSKILEFSGFTRMSAEWILEEEGLDSEVVLWRPWEWSSPPQENEKNQLFDLVICNLALEQVPYPPQEVIKHLQTHLAPDGRLLMICYNPRQISLLSQLLNGRWNTDYWGSRPFDLFSFISKTHLENYLKPDFQIAEVTKIQPEGPSPSLKKEVLELLAAHVASPLAECTHFAYTVLTTPKEHDNEHLQAFGESRSSGNYALQQS